jgi:dTDP-4-dehydrorhamnose 3,5-epimerase
MFTRHDSPIKDCFLIEFKKMSDLRGSFSKTFHEVFFREMGLKLDFAEEYFSYSSKSVFRGMHFQVSPSAIDKMMFCVDGLVTDYVADLRKGSPSFGHWASFKLDSGVPSAVFVPKGLAHGFFVHSDSAIMQCKSSGVYDPATDVTLSYKSFGFAGEIVDPVLSERDMNAPMLETYDNPFKYTGQ